MKGAIKWFSQNHVAANALMLIVMLLGFTTWFKLRKEIFPETSADAVRVVIPYPTATPEDVENGVIIPIEEAIADVNGLKKISSIAAENQGVVTVEVETGYKVREVMSDLKSKIDAIDNFAENAESPILEEVVIASPVMSIAISADTDEKTLRNLAESLRQDLLSYQAPAPEGFSQKMSRLLRGEPTVTKAQLAGVRDYEISIEVSEQKLREYQLSHAQIAAAIRRSSLDLPGGSVKTSAGEILVRAVAKRYQAHEFENIVIRQNTDGSQLLLKDLAEIKDAFADQDLEQNFDGKPAILLNVSRVGDEDTLELSDLVKRFVEEQSHRLPEGVHLKIWNDQSVYLQGRLDLLVKNGASGLILVVIVLAMFLRPDLALLVALGIPASFAGAIWVMPMLGVSVNMISLFGFILVLGIVVDDAIVVGENVYQRIEQGEEPQKASWIGANEVGVVVIFGVLTTMVAFTPMLGVSGVSGKIWPNIPLVVIPVLFFSLLQAKLVLPAHLALLKRSKPAHEQGWFMRMQGQIGRALNWFIRRCYLPTLKFFLDFRYLMVAISVVIMMLVVGLIQSGRIKSEFFPQVEADILSVKLEMERGASFEATQEAIAKLDRAAVELANEFKDRAGNSVIRHRLASSGTQPTVSEFAPNGPPKGTNLGELTLELSPAAGRDISANQLISRWREKVGSIPGAVVNFAAISAGGGNAIDLQIRGDDLKELEAAAAYLKQSLAKYSGVIDISSSNRLGKGELVMKSVKPAAEAMGLSLDIVAEQIRGAIYGVEVQRLQRGRNELKVMVRYPESARKNLAGLENLKIRLPSGAEVPLGEVVEFEHRRGPDVIQRQDRSRSINVTADIDKTSGANANQVRVDFEEQILKQLDELYPGVSWGFEGEQKDQAQSLKEMGIGFLLSLAGMYVLLAIPLRSYLQPFIIMSVIPFGIVGAVAGHLVMGLELSIMSMCGVVALAGVVVNDSLVLVDYMNQHRNDSPTLKQAAVSAGMLRFRPIMLTSVTTFFGLMPIVFETDLQARFLIPMSVSLGYGILFATLITLFLVPAIYLILDDFNRLGGILRGKKNH